MITSGFLIPSEVVLIEKWPEALLARLELQFGKSVFGVRRDGGERGNEKRGESYQNQNDFSTKVTGSILCLS